MARPTAAERGITLSPINQQPPTGKHPDRRPSRRRIIRGMVPVVAAFELLGMAAPAVATGKPELGLSPDVIASQTTGTSQSKEKAQDTVETAHKAFTAQLADRIINDSPPLQEYNYTLDSGEVRLAKNYTFTYDATDGSGTYGVHVMVTTGQKGDKTHRIEFEASPNPDSKSKGRYSKMTWDNEKGTVQDIAELGRNEKAKAYSIDNTPHTDQMTPANLTELTGKAEGFLQRALTGEPFKQDKNIIGDTREQVQSKEDEHLRSNFFDFAYAVVNNLSPETFVGVNEHFNSLQRQSQTEELRKRFTVVETLDASGVTTKEMGFKLDVDKKTDNPDIKVVLAQNKNGENLRIEISGKTNVKGEIVPNTGDKTPVLSQNERARVASMISRRPEGAPVTKQADPGSALSTTVDGIAYDTFVTQSGDFTIMVQGAQGQPVNQRVDTTTASEALENEQSEVFNDSKKLKADLAKRVLSLYQNADDEKRSVTYMEGPRDSIRVRYSVLLDNHLVSAIIPLDYNTLAPEVSNTERVELNAQDKNGAHSLIIGSELVRKKGKPLYIVAQTTNTESSQKKETKRYVISNDFAFTKDGKPISVTHHDYPELLDLTTYQDLKANAETMMSQAENGIVVKAPSLKALEEGPQSIVSFKKKVQRGDTTWGSIADAANPRWEGQDQVTAGIVTSFMKANGENPENIQPGDTVTTENLTQEQAAVLFQAATTKSKGDYINKVAPTFRRVLENSSN